MSWFCSVCEKSFSRMDSMQRHVMSKHRNAGLTPFKTVPTCFWNDSYVETFHSSNVFTEMSAVSLPASFHLHDCRNDRVRKNGLGLISIATSFRDHLTSPGEDRLALFTMAAPVYRNASRHATPWIRQGNSHGFGARFPFWCEQTEFDRVRQQWQANCEPLYSWFWSSQSERDLYRAEFITSVAVVVAV